MWAWRCWGFWTGLRGAGGLARIASQSCRTRFAFPAPQSTYAITNGNELNFLEPMLAAELTATAQLPVDTSVRYLPSRSGSELAVFHFEPKAPRAAGKRRLTLLWSHGNAMDCGELHGFLSQLSLELDVGIVAYDYSGYGASTGLPSERNLLLDSQSVYDWIRSSLNVDVAHEPSFTVSQWVPGRRCIWRQNRPSAPWSYTRPLLLASASWRQTGPTAAAPSTRLHASTSSRM